MSQIPIGHIGLIDPIARLHSKPDWVPFHILKDPISARALNPKHRLHPNCANAAVYLFTTHTHTHTHERTLPQATKF